MKQYNNILFVLCAALIGFVSCADFDDINFNPKEAQADQTQAYYALNKSILDAQQDPHIAERIFVYNWKSAARYHEMNHFATGTYNDGYMGDYHNGYISGWMKSATLAMNLADEQLASGKVIGDRAIFVANVKQVARIWYAYLTSEYVDNFGVAPTGMRFGEIPEFKSCQEVYYYMLEELKDATSKIDETIEPTSVEKRGDPAYEFNFSKWIKYANSMRLRLAMRLSEVDAAKARAEFEAVDKSNLITTAGDIFRVAEKDVWDNLAGPMSRAWNQQCISMSMFNIMTGLGGIESSRLLTEEVYEPYFRPDNYLGLYLPDHFSEHTDNPSKQFWMDGIPHSVDPRSFKLHFLPGDKKAFNYSTYADGETEVRGKENLRALVSLTNDKDTVAFVNADFSWNGVPTGFGGPKYTRNQLLATKIWGAFPSLGDQYRRSKNHRVFFGDWETHFLLAEGALRGWNAGTDAKTAYENGIKASFVYNECSAFFGEYISSKSYSRVGTSVDFDHTTEPPTTVTMNYKNGYTHAPGTYAFQYPTPAKNLYKAALNDKLTKIITQKYIAQMPYVVMEAWSDHRRLGLPFLEIPAAEEPLPQMPDWTVDVWKSGQKVSLYPQRFRFPSSLNNADPSGYQKALQLLGGPDHTLTPLWWAKR